MKAKKKNPIVYKFGKKELTGSQITEAFTLLWQSNNYPIEGYKLKEALAKIELVSWELTGRESEGDQMAKVCFGLLTEAGRIIHKVIEDDRQYRLQRVVDKLGLSRAKVIEIGKNIGYNMTA